MPRENAKFHQTQSRSLLDDFNHPYQQNKNCRKQEAVEKDLLFHLRIQVFWVAWIVSE
jgi:hypothetical protein